MRRVKILTLIAVVAVISIIASGCKSVNTNDGAKALCMSRMKVPFAPVMEHKDKKVNGEASVHVLFGIFSWGQSEFADDTNLGSSSIFSAVCKAKAAAVYKACKANNADVLLATKYEINTSNYLVYKKINCKVSGFPAVIKGIVSTCPMKKKK